MLPQTAENCPTQKSEPPQDISTGLDLSPRKLQAIEALVAGMPACQVARLVGISRRQLFTWMHEDAAFVAEWRRCQMELRRVVRANLEVLGGLATQTIRRVLTGRKATVSQKLRAAGIVLGLTVRDPAPLGADDPEGILLEFSRFRRRRGLDRLDAASRRALEDLARDAFGPPPSSPDGPAEPTEEDLADADRS